MSKHPMREDGLSNHLGDEVDADQSVFNKELSLCASRDEVGGMCPCVGRDGPSETSHCRVYMSAIIGE